MKLGGVFVTEKNPSAETMQTALSRPSPLSLGGLARANLAGKPARSLMLVLIVAVFTLLLFSGAMFIADWQRGVSSLSARLGADMLVVPQGEGKKIENVLLRAQPSTFYLDEKFVDIVREVPGSSAVSGQLFVSSLAAQCCTVQVQLIGFDPKTDFVVRPWLREALRRPLSDDEIIVGHYIVGEVGSTLTFFDQPFKIVGQLEQSGMGFDSSVFMTMKAARALGQKRNPEKAQEIAHSVSSVLVRVEPGVDPLSISDGVLDRVGLKGGVNFVFASALMTDTASRLRTLMQIMAGAGVVLWVGAAIMLFTVFSFAFNERAAERATLRALGASIAQLKTMVTVEATWIGLVGSVLGVSLGALVYGLFSETLAQRIGMPGMGADALAWGVMLVVTMLAGVLTPVLASRLILRRLSAQDVYVTMREG